MTPGRIADWAGFPKLIKPWRESMAIPVGRNEARSCIHGGTTSIGHQHPPNAARTIERKTQKPVAFSGSLKEAARNIPRAEAKRQNARRMKTTPAKF